MSLVWEQVVVDAREPRELGRWWATALGWVVVHDADGEFEIRPDATTMPGLLFVPAADDKAGKNRLHIDLRPDGQAVEVARLIALGARLADIGQGDVPWTVLLDPEGNEFCVLREHEAS